MEDRGGLAERDAGNDPEGARRQPVVKKVALDDIDPAGADLGRGLPEPRCPDGVDLDGDDIYTPPRKGARERAGSCTYLYDELAGQKIGGVYEALCALRTKEVLAETAASLVSQGPCNPGHGACPPVPGHGSPPSHPRNFSTSPGPESQRTRASTAVGAVAVRHGR